jgi:predicted AlkP superfamily phosphohydrolase/phosphomutase
MDYQNQWLGRAGRYLMETQQWDLFAMQCHCIDFANHAFVPRHGWTETETETNLNRLARCYQSVDRMVGEILAGAGENALVCVVSDHGATESPRPEVFVDRILEEAGLLVYEPSSEGQVRPAVDRSRTVAQQQRAAFIYVNLQGREPAGIVAPEDYEDVCDQIIDVLRSYREPTTGRNPFSMILRKEDARILGLYDSLGRDIGDVVYALLPEFDHEHGRQLPGATVGGQTMKPLLAFHGPGIKAGTVAERTAWLVDVAPTLAEVMGWPVPTETDGAVLYQILSTHSSEFPREGFLDQQRREMESVRARFAREGDEGELSELTTTAETRSTAGDMPDGEKSRDPEEPLPTSIEELQAALIEARREAQKWKSAYEQYHRITHGN